MTLNRQQLVEEPAESSFEGDVTARRGTSGIGAGVGRMDGPGQRGHAGLLRLWMNGPGRRGRAGLCRDEASPGRRGRARRGQRDAR